LVHIEALLLKKDFLQTYFLPIKKGLLVSFLRKISKEVKPMNIKKEFPSREELNEAFHLLQDQITKIAVEEEQEMVSTEKTEKNGEI
jgi:arsenate reductase-like glutaredoxin family protein